MKTNREYNLRKRPSGILLTTLIRPSSDPQNHRRDHEPDSPSFLLKAKAMNALDTFSFSLEYPLKLWSTDALAQATFTFAVFQVGHLLEFFNAKVPRIPWRIVCNWNACDEWLLYPTTSFSWLWHDSENGSNRTSHVESWQLSLVTTTWSLILCYLLVWRHRRRNHLIIITSGLFWPGDKPGGMILQSQFCYLSRLSWKTWQNHLITMELLGTYANYKQIHSTVDSAVWRYRKTIEVPQTQAKHF